MAVGAFDEDFFCYVEDVDLAFRLRLAGYGCWLVGSAVVRHVVSGSTGYRSDFSVYYGHRNLVLTYVKNMPVALLLITLPLHLFVNLLAVLVGVVRGQGLVVLKAKWDAFRCIPATLKKRRLVQRTRRATICELARAMDWRLRPVR